MFSFSRTLISAILLLAAHVAGAQTFGLDWITAPWAEQGDEVWFRRTFEHVPHAATARAYVATTGYAQLYVNGRNVSTSPLEPLRRCAECGAKGRTYDITPYMRAGRVTVALCFVPQNDKTASQSMVALHLWGVDDDGQRFSFATDSTWLCRPSMRRRVTEEGISEVAYGDAATALLGYDDEAKALWTGARPACALPPLAPESAETQHRALIVSHVRRPASVSTTSEGVDCDFGTAFVGFVRLTLRGANAGDRLMVGNTMYVCNGLLDEQICAPLTPTTFRTLHIGSPDDFDYSAIQNIEAIETSTADVDFF